MEAASRGKGLLLFGSVRWVLFVGPLGFLQLLLGSFNLVLLLLNLKRRPEEMRKRYWNQILANVLVCI